MVTRNEYKIKNELYIRFYSVIPEQKAIIASNEFEE